MLIHKIRQNSSGFILATVIVMTLVLAVVILSFLSLSTSQAITGQTVVDEIVAEQLAIGRFYEDFQYKHDECRTCPIPNNCASCPSRSLDNVPLNGKNYTVNLAELAPDPQHNNANAIQSTVTY